MVVLDRSHAGRRAIVLNTQGVPGLDKIRISFESDGDIAEIKRLDAVRLSLCDTHL